MQHLLASFIAHSVTPHREEFQFSFELAKRFRMDAKPSNTAMSCIERVSEELDVHHTTCNGLFAVDFEVEFLLYEVRDTFLDAFCRSWSLAEDYAIVGVTYKRVSAFLQLLVKFVENDIAKKWTERTALRSTYITLLHNSVDHYSCFKILMYQ